MEGDLETHAMQTRTPLTLHDTRVENGQLQVRFGATEKEKP